jgi:3-oxoacyl-[acyl-carrier protein] reductase
MSVPLANWLVVRNVVVTGGSRGLGLGVVRKLAAEGYHAIAVARQNNTQLASAINHAKQFGPGALDFVSYDLGEIQGIAELVRKLRKKFGRSMGLSTTLPPARLASWLRCTIPRSSVLFE